MFYIGVDLGQRRDHSAIAVVERREWRVGDWRERGEAALVVRHLERIRLGTAYTEVVRRVVEVARHPALAGQRTLVVDATGVGLPVVDMLRAAQPGCGLMAVMIAGGEGERSDGRVWHVGKVDLLAGVQMLLEQGELGIAKGMREAGTLVRELASVKVRYRGSGRAQLGAEGVGEHDDLVIALALACWAGRKGKVGERRERLFW
jgi:hypothetical protein